MTSAFEFEEVGSHVPTDPWDLITQIVGMLSIMGCIFNIAITAMLRKSKGILGKMVIILACFCLLTHIPLVLNSFETTSNRLTCEYIGSWVSYFGYASSLFFTTCFGHSLYHSLKTGSVEIVEQHFKKYVALSVISGFIMGSSAVLLQFKTYKHAQALCTSRQVDGFDWGILIILVIPGVINIIGCTFYYILIMKMLRSMNGKMHWGLLVYPLILVVCISPGIARRIFFLIGFDNAKENKTGYLYLQISRGLFGAQGFLNSLAYGLSREIYDGLRRCCSPKKRSEDPLIKSFSSVEETQVESQHRDDLKVFNSSK